MPDSPAKHIENCAFQSTGASLAMALRDFFLASNARLLENAVTTLSGLCSIPAVPPHELEYEFNRLFIGPAPPLAPPYASVYLEKEPRLMGETTQAIGHFYNALGLELSMAGMPPDFVALELEAWLVLELSLKETANADLQQGRQYLLTHMNSWLPLFTGRMRAFPLSAPMAKVADLVDEWLKAEKDKI